MEYYLHRRIGGKFARIRAFGTVDFETVGFSKDIVGIGACQAVDKIVKFRDVADLMEHLRLHPKFLWFVYNLDFDSRYIYHYIIRHPELFEFYRPRTQGENTIIEMTIKYRTGETVTLRDAQCLYAGGLEKMTEYFAPQYKKGHVDFEKEVWDWDNPDHQRYLDLDLIGLLVSLQEMDRQSMETYNVHLRRTAASLAMAQWQTTIPPDVKYRRLRPKVDTFARKGAFGGRVFADKCRKYLKTKGYDVNGEYAAAMRRGVPYGCGVRTTTYHPTKPGVYRCRVTVPDVKIPFIAVRLPDGSLKWPTGVIEEAYVYSNTIEHFRKYGYTFEVIEGYVFDKIIYPFDAYVDQCEKIEQEKPGTPEREMAKLGRCSLYGKFLSKIRGKNTVFAKECPRQKGVIWAPMLADNGDAIPYHWFSMEDRSAPFMLPHWGAWITSEARIITHTYIELVGEENVLYVDTDGFITFQAIELASSLVGTKYGQVKNEKEAEWFEPFGLKNYRYKDAKTGRIVKKCKGVPKRYYTDDAAERVSQGQDVVIEWVAPSSPFGMMRGEDFSVKRKRTIRIGVA